MSNYLNHILRLTIQNIRKRLNIHYQNVASDKVGKNIEQLPVYQEAKHIALYHAVNGEVNLNAIWENAIQNHKICYFPVLNNDKTLHFLPATPETPCKKNRFGIKEPLLPHQHTVNLDRFDIMFLPLVAFDGWGGRLGMGAGYYDKTLAHIKPKCLIGIAYDFQYQPLLLQQPWDIPLHAIITPTQIYWSPRHEILVNEI